MPNFPLFLTACNASDQKHLWREQITTFSTQGRAVGGAERAVSVFSMWWLKVKDCLGTPLRKEDKVEQTIAQGYIKTCSDTYRDPQRTYVEGRSLPRDDGYSNEADSTKIFASSFMLTLGGSTLHRRWTIYIGFVNSEEVCGQTVAFQVPPGKSKGCLYSPFFYEHFFS